jgi:hypothetical protein
MPTTAAIAGMCAEVEKIVQADIVSAMILVIAREVKTAAAAFVMTRSIVFAAIMGIVPMGRYVLEGPVWIQDVQWMVIVRVENAAMGEDVRQVLVETITRTLLIAAAAVMPALPAKRVIQAIV